ncbi:C/D box methylation guide ribonucleoprotein complex aNOP56 subunit, partial [Candidatus Woesearchaeota archaeon]|nr:C/D box methylation guide ribonucleoprotein complex aNOP56 subunit [Candidatus Woesearchaeota archaeon]
DYEKKEAAESKLKKKYKDWKAVPEDKLDTVLEFFKDKKYFERFYNLNLELTKKGIKESVSDDLLIIQTISNIEELNKVCNVLVKRLKEWYSWYCPELVKSLNDHETLVELMIKKNKNDLLKELKVKESMGAELKKEDVDEMLLLGKEILRLYELRNKHETYLEKMMKKYCPNILELAGANIGAKLLELGKGLKRLALLPSSTVQLLGAEKALFRHIKTGSKSPKYGVIINHPLIQKADKKHKGKASRMLADKISLCARLDYFKGAFKAKEYKKELEGKIK